MVTRSVRFSSAVAHIAVVFGVLCAPSASSYASPGTDETPAAACRATAELAARLLPEHADRFVFEAIPAEDDRDVFEIESVDGRTVIRGNNGVSMAMGLNWYLKHYCRCHVSWRGSQLNLPDPLPKVAPKVRQASWAKHRYFLNYCCFGYSLPFWHWEQWERLIDWMALNGVSIPLAVTGQEAVWRAVGRRLDLTDAEIEAFLGGPPYLPFGWMGCLDGWGGPLPADWIDRHEALGKRILTRQRELGMAPVLQGFTGHVPAAIARKHPEAKLHRIHWIEWETYLLDPIDPLFVTVAKLFLEEQTRRFGTDHFYAADTFIEMTPPSGEPEYLANLGAAIHGGMTATDPDAIWVLQGWPFYFARAFWTQPRIAALLGSIPDDRMLVLDLYCEERPVWNLTEAFCGKPWLWCNIQNFGCNVHLGGSLTTINQALPAARSDSKGGRLVGLGFVNEGLGYNPVVYDLMFEAAWRDGPVDLEAWIADYAHHRYGKANPDATAAWQILRETVYTAPHRTRSIIDRFPSLNAASAPPYDNRRLAAAWRHLLQAADDVGSADTYRYDLVNVARQTLSNYATARHRAVVAARRAGDAEAFRAAADEFLGLMRDLDELLATRSEFLLGRWLEDAKAWGTTDTDRARLEWNARRVLTLWGETPQLRDYARKEWSGMIAGFYLPRWERFLREQERIVENGVVAVEADRGVFEEALFQWEKEWADRQDAHPTEPQGDSIAVARRLWEKYGEAAEADSMEPAPDAKSLTTGKPVTCSSELPTHPARLAADGIAGDTDRYWATDVTQHPGEAWWQVDLEEPASVSRVVVVGYYGDRRHYGFVVETSLDGHEWKLAADQRDNAEPSTGTGYTCRFPPRRVRYIRVRQTHNSANSGRHLVEVMAYEE